MPSSSAPARTATMTDRHMRPGERLRARARARQVSNRSGRSATRWSIVQQDAHERAVDPDPASTSPSYSTKPSFLNVFMKKSTGDRVVPTISDSVVCEIFATNLLRLFCFPYRASSRSARASLFSLELKS